MPMVRLSMVARAKSNAIWYHCLHFQALRFRYMILRRQTSCCFMKKWSDFCSPATITNAKCTSLDANICAFVGAHRKYIFSISHPVVINAPSLIFLQARFYALLLLHHPPEFIWNRLSRKEVTNVHPNKLKWLVGLEMWQVIVGYRVQLFWSI